jgi:hypothetical protein
VSAQFKGIAHFTGNGVATGAGLNANGEVAPAIGVANGDHSASQRENEFGDNDDGDDREVKVVEKMGHLRPADRNQKNRDQDVADDGGGAGQALLERLANEVKEAGFNDGDSADVTPDSADGKATNGNPGGSGDGGRREGSSARPELCRVSSRVVPCTENGSSDTNAGGALLDSDFKVVRHASWRARPLTRRGACGGRMRFCEVRRSWRK